MEDAQTGRLGVDLNFGGWAVEGILARAVGHWPSVD